MRDDIGAILVMIEGARSTDDFHNCSCRLSVLLEKWAEQDLQFIIRDTNLYVELPSRIFNNSIFSRKLESVLSEDYEMDSKKTPESLADRIEVNAALSLAFFPVAVALPTYTEKNIQFIRTHFSNLIKRNHKTFNNYDISFTNICFQLEALIANRDYQCKLKFPFPMDGNFFYGTMILARSLAGVSFLSLSIGGVLADQFKKAVTVIDTARAASARSGLSNVLNSIYGAIHRIEKGANSYINETTKTRDSVRNFYEAFRWNNEKHLFYYIKEVTSGFQYQATKSFHDVVMDKTRNAGEIRNHLLSYAKSNLSAFQTVLGGEEREWANKVFINSIKTMSVIDEVKDARDQGWVFLVALHEMTDWIYRTHEIININEFEDDFKVVSPFLKEENVRVEWKASLYTPLQGSFINAQAEEKRSHEVFLSIVRAVLALLNTDGGTIIVGYVEKPDIISRPELMSKIAFVYGKSFFSVGEELKALGRSLDDVRLQILEHLKNQTGVTVEQFNDRITLERVNIRNNNDIIAIVKITVTRLDAPIYTVKVDEHKVTWVTLVKRGSGESINVDPRLYLKKS